LWRAETFAVLGVFWLLALVVGWLVARGLVGPLHNLASRLPDIERAGPLELPESGRGDEIGDVARAFVRTRTALQEARAQGQRAEKLAVLGRMTAALAHEIQNPVAAIKMHAQLWCAEDGNGTAPVIEREASRIEELLNQWLFLSRPEPPRLVPVDAGALLAQVALAHRAQLEHAQVRLELDAPRGSMVEGDARRLGQVFANLLVNAVQAMPRGGVLQVTAGAEGGQVRVRFLDSGRGFSAQALLRLGEFFFSEREGGMGIGLSVAMEIVKAHGGELSAANRSEGGAIVTVTLRRSEAS
jgi:signal transduction histidine kinase